MRASKRTDAFPAAGIGVAACTACCAGPVLGFVAAIGLFTVAGVVLFGTGGLLVLVLAGMWWARRRTRQRSCTVTDEPVPVLLGQRL